MTLIDILTLTAAGCGELCSTCLGDLGEARENAKDEIVKRLALMTKDTCRRAGQLETVLLFGRRPLSRGHDMAVSISSLRQPYYTGEFILLCDCEGEDWVEGLRWAAKRQTEPWDWGGHEAVPALRTECDIALQILQKCSDEEVEAGIFGVVDIRRLEFWVGPPGIYNITEICEDDMKARRAQSSAQAAMLALNRSFQGPPPPRPRAPATRKAAGDARSSRVHGGQGEGHQRRIALGDTDPEASESDHVHWVDAQDVGDRAVVAVHRRKVRLPPVITGYRASPNQRQVQIDGMWFSELVPGGGDNPVAGYSLECPWHSDCVRDCTFGTGRRQMTPEECRRRLLAWAADGKDIDRAMHWQRGRSQLLVRYKNYGR